MDDQNRFTSIEPASAPLPENIKSAISRLNRFESLEIAGEHLAASVKTVSINRVLCPNCGQANEKERSLCWACFKPLVPPPVATPDPGQEICVVLDGVSYRSSDPQLPPDIQELIDRIKKEGYSDGMMKEWRSWRATRNASGRVQAFQGQRVSVLRLDGILYKSDDPNLPPEISEIFGFIEKEGITPALMQHLRLYGTKVKYRSISVPRPSDGDLNFWDAARKAFKGLE